MRKLNIYIFTIISLYLCCLLPALNAQNSNAFVQFSEHKYLPFYNFKKAGNTTIFQGNRKRKNYFEGWYFKMVAQDGASIMSVIPGISLSDDGKEQHAFIQLINGRTAETSYFYFPIEEFFFSKKDFAIKIGDNYFSKDKVILNIKQEDITVTGNITLSQSVEYSAGGLNPGIMGWYRFVPFMECYHGVVHLSNKLDGNLKVNDEQFDFSDAKGYIEKDWGSSMPSSWIWMQSNHFNDSNSSFMLSIANIPWLGNSFNGFLGFFWHDNQVHHFATYRSTKLHLDIDSTDVINIKIENRKHTLLVQARPNQTGMLKAPAKGAMDRRIPESIDAILNITMLDKNGKVIYKDSSIITGLEMVGDYKALQGLLK